MSSAGASIGLVANNPVASATSEAEFLCARGFETRVVLDAEPELPIAFVATVAMSVTFLKFRRHVVHLPRPQPVARVASGL